MTPSGRRVVLTLPQLDGGTAAILLDVCCQLQVILWRVYGDEIEAYWAITHSDQPIYGPPLDGELPPYMAQQPTVIERTERKQRTTPAAPRKR